MRNTMRNRKMRLIGGHLLLAALLGSQLVFAAWQGQPKLKSDDVYFVIARHLVAQSESPVTGIVSALDEVIEVGEIKVSDTDGKATVTIKERVTNRPHLNQTIQVVLAPAGNDWKWETFENDRRPYPVERLFPYAKDEIGRRKQAAVTRWSAVLEAMTKQADAAFKLLETAKAIIKSDPAPMGAVTTARTALAEARKSGDLDAIRNAHKQVAEAVEPVAGLADNFPDLKANDAYLRLQEEFTSAQKGIEATRKSYLEAVTAYNEILQRLPFALVAYGLGFTKLEPQIEAE
jgi:LemA protein